MLPCLRFGYEEEKHSCWRGNSLSRPRSSQRLFHRVYLGRPAVIKQRFSKKYRHPTLDAKLTSRRLTGVRPPWWVLCFWDAVRIPVGPVSICELIPQPAAVPSLTLLLLWLAFRYPPSLLPCAGGAQPGQSAQAGGADPHPVCSGPRHPHPGPGARPGPLRQGPPPHLRPLPPRYTRAPLPTMATSRTHGSTSCGAPGWQLCEGNMKQARG